MKMDSNTSNLLGLARTAQLGGNQEEALGYFNRVLEADPTISEAWIGKGIAAGWQSSLANIRLTETIVAFGHAIATAPDPEKPSTTSRAVEEVNRLVATLYGMARKQLDEHVALQSIWPQYLNQVAQLLNALDEVKKWAPDDRTTLENIIHLCKDNIEGISYQDPYDYNAAKAWHLSPEYEALIKSRLDAAVAELRAFDPSYSAPTIEKKTADACFVVTATMGDSEHPTVRLMRRFRDERLMPTTWGSRFMAFYYRFGPRLADFIAPRPALRKLALVLVITPAALVARRLMPMGTE